MIFKTADYVDTGAATGTVTLSGIADPGAKISIFSDNALIAEAKADRDGSWRVVVQKKLGTGQHNFRAEQGGAGAGTLARTAMVTIERVEPKPEPPKAQPVAAAPPTVAAAEKKESAGTYIIRRGDTLWAIAKRYLGSGLRYTSIFQDNRKVIRNPNLIHPQQELNVPAPLTRLAGGSAGTYISGSGALRVGSVCAALFARRTARPIEAISHARPAAAI